MSVPLFQHTAIDHVVCTSTTLRCVLSLFSSLCLNFVPGAPPPAPTIVLLSPPTATGLCGNGYGARAPGPTLSSVQFYLAGHLLLGQG